MIVNILGTDWFVDEIPEETDELLKDCYGYCDKTAHMIVIARMPTKDTNLSKPEVFRNKVLRHEIIHAFLCESGLCESNDWDEEQMVDWLAYQFPKLAKAMKECECDG